MRTLSAVLLLAAASGCSQNQLHFEERSNLESRTTSVVLYDNGFVGQGTMNEQTCQFDALNGFIIADYDLPTNEELMQDVRGRVAIARTIEGIHVIDDEGWDQNNDIAIEGVRHVRMTNDGVASLIGDQAGCRIDWRNDDLVETVGLASEACEAPGFAVDPVTRQVWVATGSQILTAEPEGEARSMDIEADLLAFDETTGNIFAAKAGLSEITAITPNGDTLWTQSVRGGVHDLTDMGAMGASVSVVQNGNDVSVRVLDGAIGTEIANYDLPSIADVVVSQDASTMALVTSDIVYFYDVMEGNAPLRFNEVETEPPPMFAD